MNVAAPLTDAPRAASPVGVPFWSGVSSAVLSTVIGFAACIAAGVIVMIGGGHSSDFTAGHLANLVIGLAFYAAGGAFAWRALNHLRPGLIRPLTARDVRIAVLGFVILLAARFAIGIGLALLNVGEHVQAGFEHFSVATPQPSTTLLGAVLATASLVIVAPLVEEIVFRGLLFGALVRPIGMVFAAIVSGALFAALHGDLIAFPAIAALGIIAAVVYARTQNLVAAMLIHAGNNAIGAIFLIPAALHPR